MNRELSRYQESIPHSKCVQKCRLHQYQHIEKRYVAGRTGLEHCLLKIRGSLAVGDVKDCETRSCEERLKGQGMVSQDKISHVRGLLFVLNILEGFL